MTRQEQMKFHELQALWHIASATTGACNARQIFHGGADGVPLTDAEKVKHDLDIAQTHIGHFYDLAQKTW